MVRGGREKEKDAGGGEVIDMEIVGDILWAVNKIKSQKQRPSEEHICKVVEGRSGIARKEISKQMELAVKAGHVIKVSVQTSVTLAFDLRSFALFVFVSNCML